MVIDGDKEYAVAEEYRDKLSIKTPSVEQLVGNLSGGNQQKVLLAKWMFAEPDVLLMDEPTRGIDVGAKFEIYKLMIALARKGKALLMVSSELPELLGMCDRIYVLCQGRIPVHLEENGYQRLIEPHQRHESQRQQEQGFQQLDAEGVPKAPDITRPIKLRAKDAGT